MIITFHIWGIMTDLAITLYLLISVTPETWASEELNLFFFVSSYFCHFSSEIKIVPMMRELQKRGHDHPLENSWNIFVIH
jgi:hypothetical protein